MELRGAQQAVDNWIQAHGVRYFDELTNMAQLTEEVGEVARIIARRYGEQSEKESDRGKTSGRNWPMWSLSSSAWPTRPGLTWKPHSTENST